MRGILIGSGQYIPLDLLRMEIDRGGYLVAIDGGSNYLYEIGRLPDLLIGDQDSIDGGVLDWIRSNEVEELKFPSEKDSTDMELGIDYLHKKGCRELVIFGGTGTRLDHSLANIFLLDRIDSLGMEGQIIDRNNRIFLVDGSMKIPRGLGEFVSLIPLTRSGAVVDLEGFKYPLDGYFMRFNTSIGISNEISDEYGLVRVKSGSVLVFISKD